MKCFLPEYTSNYVANHVSRVNKPHGWNGLHCAYVSEVYMKFKPTIPVPMVYKSDNVSAVEPIATKRLAYTQYVRGL